MAFLSQLEQLPARLMFLLVFAWLGELKVLFQTLKTSQHKYMCIILMPLHGNICAEES